MCCPLYSVYNKHTEQNKTENMLCFILCRREETPMNSICVKLLCCTTGQSGRKSVLLVLFLQQTDGRENVHICLLWPVLVAPCIYFSANQNSAVPPPPPTPFFPSLFFLLQPEQTQRQARALDWQVCESNPGLSVFSPLTRRLPFGTHSCGQAANQHSSSNDQYTFAVTNPVPAAATQTGREISTTAAQKPFPPIDNSSLNGNLLQVAQGRAGQARKPGGVVSSPMLGLCWCIECGEVQKEPRSNTATAPPPPAQK